MSRVAKHDLSHISFEGKAPSRPQRPPAHGVRSAAIAAAAPAPEERLDEFIAWVLGRAGLDASAYRARPLQRRLPACLRALKVHSTRDARERLERQPQLIATIVSSLLIGVTEFFREPDVFDSLRTEIVPALAGRKGPLRIWSAACSTGAELYSMAILLAQSGLLERSFLLGTDCRGDAIEHAETGLYDATALKLVSPATQDAHFEPAGRAMAAGRGAAPAGSMEGRRSAGRRGRWAVGRHPLAECGHLPQVAPCGNGLAPVGVGSGPGGRVGCRQGRAAAA